VKPEVSARSTWLGLLFLFVLLAALAALQFKWTGDLSRSEGERLRRSLRTSAERLSHEFDREITRAYLQFRPPISSERLDVEAHALQSLADWEIGARFPDLVSGVVVVDLSGREPAAFQAVRKGSGFVPRPWPPTTPVAQAVTGRLAEIADPRRSRLTTQVVAPGLPGLVFPWLHRPPQGMPPRSEGWRSLVSGFVIVLFDRKVLVERVLPVLSEELLARGVGDRRPVTLEVPGEAAVAIAGGAPPAGGKTERDLKVPLFHLLSLDEVARLTWVRRARPTDLTAETRERGSGPARYLSPWIGTSLEARASNPGWSLRLYNPEATLERAVEWARWRNLLLGFGVLGVLGLSSASLVVLSRRTHHLAQRHLEFVAAVSHELRTPLAAIRALGQNLDDGVVREAEQVRQYGRRIVLESGRLGDLVERTLELGGILAGGGGRNRQQLHLDEVARRAVAECELLAAKHGTELELDIEARPAFSADPMALHGAVVNLLVNAVKFGGGPVTVKVAEERRGNSAFATLAVADHGPGIAKDDLPRLFEPFFRGQNALARRVPGSGLGLSLVRHAVEAVGGTVEVESQEGSGTTFKISFPVAVSLAHAAPNPAGRG
jgi:signal transduction histidine kinase